jgi:TolB-like protein
LILAGSFFTGCASGPQKAAVDVPEDPAPALYGSRKIAVMPFYNISGRRNAGEFVSSAYVTELFKSGRFRVEEPGNIRQFLIQERVGTIGGMDHYRLKVLGKRLRVDAVLLGTVEEFEDGTRGVPSVAVTARMVEASSGRVIWSAQNKKRGDDYTVVFDFGELRTVSVLTHMVVKEMVDSISLW